MRNKLKKILCYQRLFEQNVLAMVLVISNFFLTVGQYNFGNKIPILILQVLGNSVIRSGSPTCDNSNTATTSESGNGGSNSRSQNKTASGTKETNENNSAGDSGDGEKLYSGGTGTGTSGGNFFY